MSGKKKKKSFGIVRTIILLAALCVFAYAAWQLYSIVRVYKIAGDEYTGLADSFTHAFPAPGGADGSQGNAGESSPESAAIPQNDNGYEDADPPLTVDWDELKRINSDIVGWIYVDGQDVINYPICRGEDNDFYLHHTFRKEYLFAGSIFEDYHNSPDFTDPNTIVYGHNMKDGSMFNSLKHLNNQEKYEENPYFWILTPKGNYRYRIYCITTASVDSDVYLLHNDNGPEFLKWEQQMQASSDVANDVKLSEDDKTVILSTCTSDSSYRVVVIGKCVSSERPVKPAPIPTPLLDAAGNPVQDEQGQDDAGADDDFEFYGDEVYGETYGNEDYFDEYYG